MFEYNITQLGKLLPDEVKIEILKKELNNTYQVEKKLKQKLDENNIHDIISIYFLTDKDNELKQLLEWELENLYKKYDSLFNIFSALNISKESSKILYKWAKIKRHELGLSDNLYNIFEMFIDKNITYEDINEKINSTHKSL